jgi:hypothetical protein
MIAPNEIIRRKGGSFTCRLPISRRSLFQSRGIGNPRLGSIFFGSLATARFEIYHSLTVKSQTPGGRFCFAMTEASTYLRAGSCGVEERGEEDERASDAGRLLGVKRGDDDHDNNNET